MEVVRRKQDVYLADSSVSKFYPTFCTLCGSIAVARDKALESSRPAEGDALNNRPSYPNGVHFLE